MPAAYNKSRLRWRCRRGTKELDTLLCRFLEVRFDSLTEPAQGAFADLLEQQDPTIADWLWGRAPIPANEIGDVLRMIRADSGLDQI